MPERNGKRPLLVPFLWLLGIVNLLNGAWMLAHAWSWFSWIPGVTDTGEANAHLIHDVGIAYSVCGIGFIWCARNLGEAWPVFMGITLFYVGHALGHVVEILAGMLPHSHWWIDMPLVFGPAVLLSVLALPANWKRLTHQTPANSINQ